ncbi:uncharacterized protein DUF2784 [Geodermatophilus normandii]|uniref:Uncharacterized protein DUF2784 n=1 Tax=Geodermatophilus normandii TaxID=1137989 RepID=A0A317QPA2_9ACTN|nr:uncharacterized protein DUF2784 [Geodermatophilus normandii]
MLLANAVAVLHAAVVLFMLTGALLALRWPRLALVHAPVALAVLAVNLAGAPCPLTTVELALREQAGAPPYDGGFLGHFLFGPLGLDVRSVAVQVGMYSVALGLNAVGYALLLRRVRRTAPPATTRRSARAPGRRRRGPRRRTRGPRAAAPRAGRRSASRTSAPGRR